MQIHRASTGWGFRLEASQFLPQLSEQVFEFFSDAFQLQTLTPPWLHFSVLTPAPILMATGALIDYQLRVHGIPMHWQSCIREWGHRSASWTCRLAVPIVIGATSTSLRRPTAVRFAVTSSTTPFTAGRSSMLCLFVVTCSVSLPFARQLTRPSSSGAVWLAPSGWKSLEQVPAAQCRQ